MEQLLAMGFEPFKCKRALEEARQDVRDAVDFMLGNTDKPEGWWRGTSDTAATRAAAAATRAAATPAPPPYVPVQLPGRPEHDHPHELGTRYVVRKRIGAGSYGNVYSAHDNDSGDIVALKCVVDVFRSSVDAMRALREASILRQCDHPNIVQCRAVLPPPSPEFSHLWIVLDHADWDLRQVLQMKMKAWTIGHVEVLLHQILCGLGYMHEHGIVHRDMKPANILVTRDCGVRITDFGLARQIHLAECSADGGSQASVAAGGGLARTLTVRVVTRYYRAPELLLGSHEYNSGVDIWSVGCILAEMLSSLAPDALRSDDGVMFPGESGDDVHSSGGLRSELHRPKSMLRLQFDALGYPTQAEIHSLTSDLDIQRVLEQCRAAQECETCATDDPTSAGTPTLEHRLQQRFSYAPASAVQLLANMLTYTPQARLHAAQCVCHDGNHTFADMVPSVVGGELQSCTTSMAFPFEHARHNRASLRGLILEETSHYSDQWSRA